MRFSEKVKRDLSYQFSVAKKSKTLYLFMLPYALIFFIFTVVPVVASIILSFTYFNLLQSPVFNGLTNYFKLFFNDPIFVKAVANTLMFAVIIGSGGYLLSLLFAWLINELSVMARTVMTFLFYAPSLSGGLIMIWTLIFSGDSYGYLNGILMNLGFIDNPILFLKDPTYMNNVVIIASLWMSMGAGFLSFIAGLQGIDPQYYEAASIDGIKNRWQELWFVTLPLMKPQLMFGAVMSITGAFMIGDLISGLVGNPSTNYVSHTIMHHLQDYGTTRFEMGYASAIATLLFLIMIISNKAVQKLLSKVGT